MKYFVKKGNFSDKLGPDQKRSVLDPVPKRTKKEGSDPDQKQIVPDPKHCFTAKLKAEI